MSVIAKLLSFGVARGLAALLAVLLSAVGGGRLGAERLTPELVDDERPPVACALATATAPESRAWSQVVDARCFASTRGDLALAEPALPATDHLRAPSLLTGSAGGPRAP